MYSSTLGTRFFHGSKQYEPQSDFSLVWVHIVCNIGYIKHKQMRGADDNSDWLMVNLSKICSIILHLNQLGFLFCLFVCFEALHPSQQFFSFIGRGLPEFNHY